MVKIIILFCLLLISTLVHASELNTNALQGKWLITHIGSMDTRDMKDVWEFKGKKMIVWSNGKALRPDKFLISGNDIDLGFSKINVLKFNGSKMKTKQMSFIYTLEKQ